jgi:hypothetical protein
LPARSSNARCASSRWGRFAPNSPAAKGFGQLWTAIERKLAKQAKHKG